MSNKIIKIDNVNQELGVADASFLCCASFESRSCSIPSAINERLFRSIYIFANIDCHQDIIKNANSIKDIVILL